MLREAVSGPLTESKYERLLVFSVVAYHWLAHAACSKVPRMTILAHLRSPLSENEAPSFLCIVTHPHTCKRCHFGPEVGPTLTS